MVGLSTVITTTAERSIRQMSAQNLLCTHCIILCVTNSVVASQMCSLHYSFAYAALLSDCQTLSCAVRVVGPVAAPGVSVSTYGRPVGDQDLCRVGTFLSCICKASSLTIFACNSNGDQREAKPRWGPRSCPPGTAAGMGTCCFVT